MREPRFPTTSDPRGSMTSCRSRTARCWTTAVAVMVTLQLTGGLLLPAHAAESAPPVAAPSVLGPGSSTIDAALPGTSVPRLVMPPAVSVGGPWVAQGPGRATNGQVENIPGDDPVCGAINAVAPHPTNPDILFAGGSNGGVWRTTNATSANPTWTPLTDQFPSLSIGDIEYDPTDGSHQTLVVGIGGFSSFGSNGPATGLLRTTDGGNTWTQLGAVDLAGQRIWAVLPRGNTILVGTTGGMFRSTDGGASFQNISNMNGLGSGTVFDLGTDPSDNTRAYATLGGSFGGVFRTDNTGASWTDVTSPAIDAVVSGSTGDFRVAVSAAAGNAVFVGIVNGGRLAAVFRSGNQGGIWALMDLPQTMEGPVVVGIHPGGQGSTHFSLVADPTDGNIVYIGGDRQPTNPGPDNVLGTMDDTWPNSIGARDYSGRLFRGDAGVAPTGGVPSPQWTALTHNGTASNSSPHADSRDMDFDANGNLLECSDGGIYRRVDPRSTSGDWVAVIGQLQVGEMHDVAHDSNTNTIFGGQQDTGIPSQNAPGSALWTELATADGGDVAVDDSSVPGMSTRFWSTQRLGGFRRQTYNAANVGGAVTYASLIVGGGGNPIGTQFVTPIALNSQDRTRVIIGGSNSVYESADQGDNVTELTGPGVTTNNMIYGHANNADLILHGNGSQLYRRTTAGGSLTATSGNPGVGSLTAVAVDPADESAIFVTSSTGVAWTSDGGAHWTDVTGNLADMSGDGIQSAIYVEGTTNDLLIVGAQRGIFALAEPFCGCWFELGTGLPHTFTWDLDYDVSRDLLVAGMLGRGAWSLTPVASLVAPTDQAPVASIDAMGGEVDASCVFNAPYSATITDDCRVDPTSIVVTAMSLDGLSTVGTPTKVVNVVSDMEVEVSGTVAVSALTGCPANVRISIAANDGCGAPASASKDIQVTDTTPPDIVVTLNRYSLWPPNHKMADIEATVMVTDNCPNTSWVLQSVTSDEPENGTGDGDTAPDIMGADVGTADTHFQLRSERKGNGDGRDYTIVYAASDACGNMNTATVHVLVPHDMSAAAMSSAGFTPTGEGIVIGVDKIAIVLLGETSDDTIVDVGGADGLSILDPDGPKKFKPLDARNINTEHVQLGNLAGVVSPIASHVVDANNDARADAVFWFDASDVSALLGGVSAENGKLGLHIETLDHFNYLVSDVFSLGAPVPVPLESMGDFADGGTSRELTGGSNRPSVAEAPDLPRTTAFGGIYPNPFGQDATVRFQLASPSEIAMSVFDLRGARVRTLARGTFGAGSYQMKWDGTDDSGRRLARGIYMIRFDAGTYARTAKAVLVK
jgi:FlgD Ig-like domain